MQRVLTALEGAGRRWRHQSGGIAAQCPAHDDRNPSLSLRNSDGKVLLNCKAGCQPSDVVAALGLRWADLFDPKKEDQSGTRRTVAATYDYCDATGTVLFQKVRFSPKGFQVRRSDGRGGWAWNIGDDTPRVLYRLPEVLAAVRDGRTIYLCEGEKDVDRLVSLGYAATCNYDGASQDTQRPKWRDSYSDAFVGGHIVIVADNDAAGFAHARAAMASLTGKAASVRIVRAAVDVEHADVSDHLDTERGLEDLVPVLNDDAPTLSANGQQPPTALSFAELYQPIDWHELWSTTTAEPDWLCPGILERGRLHAIYAPRKHKKSLFTLMLVAELISGRPLLGRPNPHDRPLRILYVDIENALDDIRQRLQAAGYGPDDLTNLIYLSFPSLPGLDTPIGGQHLLSLVEHYCPELVVLDTTSRVVTGKENDADTFRALYRHALAPIKATGTAILRLDHTGKDITLEQRGSSAKGDDLDTAWLVTMPALNRVTLRLAFQRTNHHPHEVEFVQHSDPLRFVRIDEAYDRPELSALIVALDRLGVPSDAGRDTARRALSDAGTKIRTELLAEAVKIRKARYSDRVVAGQTCSHESGTGASNDLPRPGVSAGHSAADLSGTGAPDNDHAKIGRPVPDHVTGSTVSAAQTCSGQVGDSGDSAERPDRAGLSPRPASVGEVGGDRPAGLTRDLEASGDRWVHAHLTTAPQTVAQLATDLDASVDAVETALKRLAGSGHAQHHPGDAETPDGWSLPAKREEA